mgnify:CR=1 FL=1
MKFLRPLSAALAAAVLSLARRLAMTQRQCQRPANLGTDDHHAVQPRRPDQRRLGPGRAEDAGIRVPRHPQGRSRRHRHHGGVHAERQRPDHRPGHRAEERSQQDLGDDDRRQLGRCPSSSSPTTRSADRSCLPRRRRRGSARRRCRSRRSGNTPASNASGLSTTRDRRAMQHRDRVQALVSHRSTPAAAARPACRIRRRRSPSDAADASQLVLPAVRAGHDAGGDRSHRRRPTAGVTVPYIVRVERGTLNRGIYDIAVLFDPTKPAWTALGAAAAVERQGGLHLRRVDRPAAAAVPHRAELGRRHGAVARLHGRRQQPDRLALQLRTARSSPRRR